MYCLNMNSTQSSFMKVMDEWLQQIPVAIAVIRLATATVNFVFCINIKFWQGDEMEDIFLFFNMYESKMY